MLAVSWDTVRLFLHVLAATIWVGGQLTLAALVPVLRRFGGEVPRAAARQLLAAEELEQTALAVLGIDPVAAGAVGLVVLDGRLQNLVSLERGTMRSARGILTTTGAG